MKKYCLALVAMLGICLGTLQPVQAEAKPVVVVSLAGYDALLADVKYLGDIVAKGQVNTDQVEGMFKILTAGKGPDLLDRKAPWGMVMYGEGEEFHPLVFLPITDVETFMTVVGNFSVGGIGDEGDDIKSIKVKQAPKFYLKAQNGYIFFAQQMEHLKNCPADPTTLLGKLPQEFDIAVKANVQNVPEATRQTWIGFIRSGMEQGLKQPTPGEDDEAFEIRKKVLETQMAQFETMLQDLETATLGITIDSGLKAVMVDTLITVKPGSDLAKSTATTSSFAGFLQANAGITGNMTSKIDAKNAQNLVSVLQGALETAKQKVEQEGDEGTQIKQQMTDFFDVLIKTVQAGKLDAAGTIAAGDKSFSAYAGATVHDGKAVEKLVKQIVENKKAELRDIKLDMGEHSGVKLHQIGIPVPDAKAQELLGDTMTVTVGIADKAAYIALGKEGLQQLKSAIDASTNAGNAKLDPASMNVAMVPLVSLLQSTEPNLPGVDMIMQGLNTAQGKDHVMMNATEVPNGVRYRLQLDEGVIRVLGMLGQLRNGGNGNGGFPAGGL